MAERISDSVLILIALSAFALLGAFSNVSETIGKIYLAFLVAVFICYIPVMVWSCVVFAAGSKGRVRFVGETVVILVVYGVLFGIGYHASNSLDRCLVDAQSGNLSTLADCMYFSAAIMTTLGSSDFRVQGLARFLAVLEVSFTPLVIVGFVAILGRGRPSTT